MAFPTCIRLGWKNLPGTNALAYWGKAQLTAVKCFITLAIGIVEKRSKWREKNVIFLMKMSNFVFVFYSMSCRRCRRCRCCPCCCRCCGWCSCQRCCCCSLLTVHLSDYQLKSAQKHAFGQFFNCSVFISLKR